MRKYIFITVLMGAGLLSACGGSGEKKTAEAENTTVVATDSPTLKVQGLCDMCKNTIETTALGVAGVTIADWHADTKIIDLQYSKDSTNIETISKAIAAVGYDTDKHKADNEVYAKLPECCKYER